MVCSGGVVNGNLQGPLFEVESHVVYVKRLVLLNTRIWTLFCAEDAASSLLVSPER